MLLAALFSVRRLTLSDDLAGSRLEGRVPSQCFLPAGIARCGVGVFPELF